jgi:Tfp pilus assembly protein PilF
MPERTYMVVDPRRDHSIRIPRPDLSLVLDTPNACNKCHTDKSVEWAAEYTKKWYGKQAHEKPHYGKVINGGRRHLPFADVDLIDASSDTSLPAIVRATTLSMLAGYTNPSMQTVIKNGLQDENPLLRMGAAEALAVFESANRFALAGHLLRDPVLSVRMAAVSHLLDVPQSSMSVTERSLMNKVINEYINVQKENGERATAHLNLATVYIRQGYQDKAEAEYRTAIRLEPYFVYSYINLADLYRGQQREKEAENLLREAISSYPGSADLHYALSLLLVRKRQTAEALSELKQAVQIRPDDTNLQYVYAIALNSSGAPDEAIRILKTVLAKEPALEGACLALTTIYRDKGDVPQAIESAKTLTEYWPYNPGYRQLLQNLQTSQP